MRRWFTMLWLFPFLHAVTANDADAARSLLEGVTTPRDHEIPFIETRMNGMLSEPLETRGTVMLASNGLIIKSIVAPFEERVLISTEALHVEKAAGDRRIRFANHPELAALAGAIRALLEGNGAAILAAFRAGAVHRGTSWSVTLVPRDADLEPYVSRLEIRGCDDFVTAIETHQADDSWQKLVLQPPIGE